MAAKSKRRLSKNENKLLKLEKLKLSDVVCSICQSILIEPVTLPCYHDFCQRCFSGSIENNALCCPLCRLRIGSWLRKTSKQKSLVNIELWKFIKKRFSREIDKKSRGEDLELSPDKTLPRLSQPGEIRSEYEAEIRRLRAEHLQLEQKHLQETENLIKKLQKEEDDAHNQYINRLKQDEMLALKIQKQNCKSTGSSQNSKHQSKPGSTMKQRLRINKIDTYLSKICTPANESSIVIDDSTTSSESSVTQKVASIKSTNRHSPEITPAYGKLLKNFLDKKHKNGPGVWNKENGKIIKINSEVANSYKDTSTATDRNVVKTKNVTQSLVVSLPLPCSGLRHHKINEPDNRSLETGSVDSMRQELCYFKPIEGTTPTSFTIGKTLPLRVPGLRLDNKKKSPEKEDPPSRDQYIEGLCQLRNLSLAKKLPSAFVVAISILKVNKESGTKYVTRSKMKKSSPTSVMTSSPGKKTVSNRSKQTMNIDGVSELNNETNLRRTRSMGSISKGENEVTPKKKINNRKVSSERKPYLRSDSKRLNAKNNTCSSPILEESLNNNKVNLVIKNLSSPLANCDVKNILREQLRIEKIIEQEKNDFELAQQVDAEWNGRRQLRRATKRQVTLNYALRPAKKVKV